TWECAVIAPSRICARNSATTTQKYLATARIDGVTRSPADGSLAGIAWPRSSLSCLIGRCQLLRPMPAIRNSTLKADQTHSGAAGRLPTSGSLGQLLV